MITFIAATAPALFPAVGTGSPTDASEPGWQDGAGRAGRPRVRRAALCGPRSEA
jgi:hypothetical protein